MHINPYSQKSTEETLRAAQAYKALACHEGLIQLTKKKSNKRLLIIKGVGESNTYILYLLRDKNIQEKYYTEYTTLTENLLTEIKRKRKNYKKYTTYTTYLFSQ